MGEDRTAEPRLAPPGRRSGEGSASIVPYLLLSLASKPGPTVPAILRRRVPKEPAVPRLGRH